MTLQLRNLISLYLGRKLKLTLKFKVRRQTLNLALGLAPNPKVFKKRINLKAIHPNQQKS